MKSVDEVKKRESVIDSVREMFPEVEFPSPVIEPLFFGRLKPKKVINRNLILDRDTGNQWDVVSDSYHLVHHEEIIDMVIKSCPAEFGKPEFKARFINDKARSQFVVTFPEIGDFKVDGSKIEAKVVVGNSYDRSARVIYSWGANELVCSNGLRAFVEKGSKKVKHLTGSFDKIDFEEIMAGTLSQFSEQVGIWDMWSKKKLTEIQRDFMVDELPFTDNEKEKLMVLPLLNKGGQTLSSLGKSATVWNINSAATQYTAHEVNSEVRKIGLEESIALSIVKSIKKI